MSQNKKFSEYEVPLSIVLFLLIIFFLSGNIWLARIAFAIGFLALISKTFTKVLSQIWGKILGVVGFVNAHVLLSLIFFLILLPISLVYRIFNKDKLNLRSGKQSYFDQRDHVYVAKDLENPW